MMENNREIWIFAEFKDGRIIKSFEELLCKSRNLFERGTTVVSAVVLGNSVEEQIAQVKEYGVDKVYAVEHTKLADYNCDYYKVAMESLIRKHNQDIILFGATVIGAELAPSVAAILRAGLAAHCVDITAEEEKVSFWVPAFGGNVIGEILIPDQTPQMASVKPGILGVSEYVKSDCTEIFKEEVWC
jgi:electron transfer flavoprotein alpha subunit